MWNMNFVDDDTKVWNVSQGKKETSSVPVFPLSEYSV